MFGLDLKSLMQVANTMEKPKLMHKRFRCGKVSFIVCYVLHHGRLTVQRARHVRTGRPGRRYRRCRRSSRGQIGQLEGVHQAACQTTSADNTKDGETQCCMEAEAESEMQPCVPNEHFKDVGTETVQLEMLDCGVNTMNPSIPVSRHQQTHMLSFMSTCSQTKTKKLEIRSTQVELTLKTRSTECLPEPQRNIGIQTKLLVQFRHSFAQTISTEQQQQEAEEEEQEQEGEQKKAQKSVLNLVMASIGHQGEMLFSCLQLLQQLIECKQLELEKQRLEVRTTVTVATQVEPQPMAESSENARMQWKKPIKVTTLNVKRAQALSKHRYWLHLQRSSKIIAMTWQSLTKSLRSSMADAEAQTELESITPTAFKWTQTEKVSNSLAVAACTQTCRERRFLWLRLKN